MSGREVPGGSHLHLLGDKTARALVERQGDWPLSPFLSEWTEAHLRLGQTLTDTHSDNHIHVYVVTHMY